MVISRTPLSTLVPIGNAAMKARTFIEWDKDDLDALGMFKVDILGLGMLTVLSKSFKLIESYDRPDQLHTIPREDAGVYEMGSDADTIAYSNRRRSTARSTASQWDFMRRRSWCVTPASMASSSGPST